MKIEILENTDTYKKSDEVSLWDCFSPIPYVKELRKLELVNSIPTCLLMARLEILFEENSEPFCKYIEPCRWQDELGGLSWCEELDVNEYLFRRHFKKIGFPYRTKKEFLQAEDKFQGKYYCCYVDTADNNKTYYFRNHELVDKCLERLLSEQMDSGDNVSS